MGAGRVELLVEEIGGGCGAEACEGSGPGGGDAAGIGVGFEGGESGGVTEEVLVEGELELSGVEVVEDGEDFDAELGGVEGGAVGDGDADGFDGLPVEGEVIGIFADMFGGGGEGDAGDVAGCEGLGYIGGFEPGRGSGS